MGYLGYDFNAFELFYTLGSWMYSRCSISRTRYSQFILCHSTPLTSNLEIFVIAKLFSVPNTYFCIEFGLFIWKSNLSLCWSRGAALTVSCFNWRQFQWTRTVMCMCTQAALLLCENPWRNVHKLIQRILDDFRRLFYY